MNRILRVPITATRFCHEPAGLVAEFDSPEAITKQIELLKSVLSNKQQRLEYYEDGIYLDGEPLGVRGRHEAILRCFVVLDKVKSIDLIYRVWGNSDVSMGNVYSTIGQFNKAMISRGIFIEKEGDCYIIHRP